MPVGSLTLPEDVDKAEVKDAYTTSMQFLDNAITQWPTLTAAQKQTWIANNFDNVLKILRAILRILGKMLG
jgi:hypothetical protein